MITLLILMANKVIQEVAEKLEVDVSNVLNAIKNSDDVISVSATFMKNTPLAFQLCQDVNCDFGRLIRPRNQYILRIR